MEVDLSGDCPKIIWNEGEYLGYGKYKAKNLQSQAMVNIEIWEPKGAHANHAFPMVGAEKCSVVFEGKQTDGYLAENMRVCYFIPPGASQKLQTSCALAVMRHIVKKAA